MTIYIAQYANNSAIFDISDILIAAIYRCLNSDISIFYLIDNVWWLTDLSGEVEPLVSGLIYRIILRHEPLNQRSFALSILQRSFLRTKTNKYFASKSFSVLK